MCDETLTLTLLFLPFLQVKFVIFYTGRGELANATVDVTLADVNQSQLLLQIHSVEFQVEPKELKKLILNSLMCQVMSFFSFS